MREIESIPSAPALIESMRSMGYSMETAIADIIDNSIAAKANEINLFFTNSDSNRALQIYDNGFGMCDEELKNAMKYGSKNPNEARSEDDLGRFGLGMKSASLSMCRKMTVFSKKNDELNAYSWDIDFVLEKNFWALQKLDGDDINEYQDVLIKMKELESGTCVYLEKFDRFEQSARDVQVTLNAHMSRVEEHLSLVFHRYIEDSSIKLTLNNMELEARDPFLRTAKKTQILKPDFIEIDDKKILVQPYILPYINQLSPGDEEKIGGKEQLLLDQGFYIYRNKRLIIYGTWFRLEKKNELNKHARILVDIPNSLDEIWQIDIKKSTANLPDMIKERLKQIVIESTDKSLLISTVRGTREQNQNSVHVWEVFKDRENGKSLIINRELPQIQLLKNQLNKQQIANLERVFELIEQLVPHEEIYNDFVAGNLKKPNVEDGKLLNDVQYVLNNKAIDKAKKRSLLEMFLKMEMYNENTNVNKRILDELENL